MNLERFAKDDSYENTLQRLGELVVLDRAD